MNYFSPDNKHNPHGKWVMSRINTDFKNERFFQKITKNDILERGNSYGLKKRKILAEVLKDQYREWPEDKNIISNINKILNPASVTVTCGHQLCLGLGPLYVHSKIKETQYFSNFLCQEHNAIVIPIFWMATEDHDYEEIRHLEFQDHKFSIKKSFKGRPVGSLPANIATDVIKEMIEKLGSNQPLNELLKKFQIAYNKGGSLADATRRLIHEMHPEVLCIDASDKRLKDMALDLWRDEILSQSLYNSRDTSIWDNAKRTPPIPFNESMMFYLKDGRRTRINFENGNYYSDGIIWSPKDLIEEIESHPERISPNALLRPIYQEFILPNMSYIGGFGEVEYWLQLIPYFKKFGKLRIRIMPRTSFSWWTKSISKKWKKISNDDVHFWISKKDFREIFLKTQGIIEEYSYPLYEAAKIVIEREYNHELGVQESAKSWLQRIKNDEKRMNKRIRRNVIKRNDHDLKKFKEFRDQHHPNDKLQERHWTVLDLVYNFGSFTSSKYLDALTVQNNGFIWILEE